MKSSKKGSIFHVGSVSISLFIEKVITSFFLELFLDYKLIIWKPIKSFIKKTSNCPHTNFFLLFCTLFSWRMLNFVANFVLARILMNTIKLFRRRRLVLFFFIWQIFFFFPFCLSTFSHSVFGVKENTAYAFS